MNSSFLDQLGEIFDSMIGEMTRNTFDESFFWLSHLTTLHAPTRIERWKSYVTSAKCSSIAQKCWFGGYYMNFHLVHIVIPQGGTGAVRKRILWFQTVQVPWQQAMHHSHQKQRLSLFSSSTGHWNSSARTVPRLEHHTTWAYTLRDPGTWPTQESMCPRRSLWTSRSR